jgi:acetylornithine deacetylase/succinyl-diaminopimelate desuccinylase family protein
MTAALSEQDKTEILNLLIKLVSIPSVNRENNENTIPEEAMAEFISEYLQQINMKCQILRMPDGRPNVFARWSDHPGSKKSLVLSAHMDTVDVAGMIVDPFQAKIEDGKIYGRGACDTKASLAIYLWLLRKIADRRDSFDRDIQFLATCDEENGCVGSTWLAERGFTADEIIIGEPTKNQIAVTHRGAMVLDFETTGLAAHASVPHKGDNALYQMCDLIATLRHEWVPRITQTDHPLLGHATASFTVIQGGVRYNIIPESCQATLDIRYLPEQSSAEILADLQNRLDQLRQTQHIQARMTCEDDKSPLATDPTIPFVRDLLDARRAVVGDAEPAGLPFMTDASPLSEKGAKCVVFGPGSINHAHSRDEFLELDQLNQAAEILLKFFEKLR